MIVFSNAVNTILQNPSIELCYCVKIDTYKTTSFPSNLTLSNGDTYLSDGRLVSVDPPRLSSSVDREIYQVSLADSDFYLSDLFQTGLVGKVFEVRIILIDPVTHIPLVNLSDTILVYKGIINNVGLNIDTGNQGEAVVSINGASPMANLDATKPFYTSREFIRGLSSNDTSFDQVYEGAGPVNLRWGKG